MNRFLAMLLAAMLGAAGCAPAATPVPTGTPTAVPTATSTPTAVPTPTIVPTPTQVGGGAGQLIFDYYKVAYQKAFPDVKGQVSPFVSGLDGTALQAIAPGLKGFNYIEAVSADGKMILVSSHSSWSGKGDLYVVRVGSPEAEPIKLARAIAYARTQAVFLDDSEVAYIGPGEQGIGLYAVNIDGTNPRKIGAPSGQYAYIAAANGQQVYWVQFENKTFKFSDGFKYAYGTYPAYYWANTDGSGQGKLESGGEQVVPWGWDGIAFSPDATKVAWIPAQRDAGCTYFSFVSSMIRDGSYTKQAAQKKPGASGTPTAPPSIDMAWATSYVQRCLVIYVASTADMDKPVKIALLPPQNLLDGDFSFGIDYNPAWSPDGTKVLLFNNGADGYYQGFNHEPVLYEVNPTDAQPLLRELKPGLFAVDLAGKLSRLVFSPDGREALAYTQDGPYVRILNLDTGTFSDAYGNALASDPNVQQVRNIFWLP